MLAAVLKDDLTPANPGEKIAPIENLRRVLECERIEDFPIEWVRNSFQRYLRPGADLRLAACFGLPGQAKGARSKLRDAYLIAAAQHVAGGTWERAKELLGHIRRFKNQRLQRWRATGVPNSASPLESAVFRAFNSGAVMQTTAQAFWKILNDQAETPNEKHQKSLGGVCCDGAASCDGATKGY